MIENASQLGSGRTLAKVQRIIRRYTLLNGFAIRAYGPGVSPALESHTLFHLQSNDTAELKDITRVLQIPQSTISRVISYLSKRNLITAEENQEDRRKKGFRLTKEGKKRAGDIHTRLNNTVERFLKNLSHQEQKRFQKYVHAYANGVSEKYAVAEQAIPIRRDFIRITRGTRLLHRNRFHKHKLSALTWHILAELVDNRKPVAAKDLSEQYQVAPNTLSAALKNLEGHGFISRIISPKDQRVRPLQATKSGVALIEKITSEQITELEVALELLSEAEREDFAMLFEKFLGEHERRQEVTLQPRVTIRELTSEEEYQQARRFLMSQLLSSPEDPPLPSILVHEESTSFGLFHESLIQGVIEFQVQGAEGSIVNLRIRELEVTPDTARNFLLSSLRALFFRSTVERILVDDYWLANKFVSDLTDEEENGMRFISKEVLMRPQ